MREERDEAQNELVLLKDQCRQAEEEMLQWRETAQSALAVVSRRSS